MQKSIRQDLSIRIGLVIMVIGIIIGVAYYAYSISFQKREFKNYIDHQTKQISKTFALQLWLFDLNTTRELCKMFAGSPEVSGLRLLDHNRQVIFEKDTSPKDGTLHIHQELLHEGEKLVGYVDIYYSNTTWEHHKVDVLFVGIIMIIGTILGAFILINILLNRYLSTPLKNLQKDMAKLSHGDFKQSEIIDQKAEIQGIIDTFNELTIKLQERDEEIRRREVQLSSIFRTAPTGIAVTADRIFLDINDKVCEMLGYSEKELLGKNARMVYPSQKEYEEVGREYLRQLKKFNTGTMDTQLQHKDGTIIDVLLNMTPQDLNNFSAGITFTFMDITEIKRTQKALQESELKFREMANLLPQAVYEADTQGNLTFLNEQAYNLFGYSQEDVDKGINFLNYLIPEDRARAKENINNIVNGKPFENVEYTAMKKDGLTCPIMTYTSPIIKDDEIAGLRGIVVDISERKQMEEEILKVRKLESVGVLAGGIAHDFNNILAVILGNISLALTTTDPKDEIYELLTETEKASLRAKDLTQQLLTFSKGGEPVKKIALIDAVIKDSAEFVLRGSNVRCDFKFDEELWPVAIDTGQISQVIQNIIVNASQAMPTGGIVSIDCSNYCLKLSDTIPVSSGNYMKIVIKDQGVGIPIDMLDKIFDPYFTTKQKGSGLGLAITHSIISKHNGYIIADSELGQGTTFTIYLPASKESPKLEQEVVVMSPVNSQGKIMIMDDEEMIRSLVEKALSRIGYEVVLAEDGNEAVQLYQKAKEAGVPIDLIIMDLTIPGGMGGKEAIQEIHKIDSEAKAIVSSGYSNDPVMADFGEYGFCGAMVKPFQIRELMEVVGNAVSPELPEIQA